MKSLNTENTLAMFQKNDCQYMAQVAREWAERSDCPSTMYLLSKPDGMYLLVDSDLKHPEKRLVLKFNSNRTIMPKDVHMERDWIESSHPGFWTWL